MRRGILLFVSMISIWLLMLGSTTVKAESITPDPVHEMRAAWVATVYNIDIRQQGSSSVESIESWKQEYIKILNTLEEFNMNTIIFQIRPMNDAFYESELNPWSQFFCGFQGCDPGWDPLPWLIEETHKRGMEFHAWLNPYRVHTSVVGESGYATKEALLNSLADGNFAKENPELVIIGGDNKPILNPGEPRVKQFIVDTIEEIITKYDVDAIHFDDYFYPYSGVGNADSAQYNQYKKTNESLADWRRRNVDEVIYEISEVIRAHNVENNKAVQFGISPFGIWANKGSHPDGSDTRGNQSYFAQYADTRKWVKEEWIDYIAPQLYWHIGNSAADYQVLVKWWADVVRDTNVNLYIGHGLYKYGEENWNTINVILNQLDLNAQYPEVKGSIFYSYKHLLRLDNYALIEARNTIKRDYWDQKALSPILQLMDHIESKPVQNLKPAKVCSDSYTLRWDHEPTNKYYIVYRFENGDEIVLNNTTIFDIVVASKNDTLVQYIDYSVEDGKEYTYHITAVNLKNEESNSVSIEYPYKGEDNPDPDPDPDPNTNPDPNDGEPKDEDPKYELPKCPGESEPDKKGLDMDTIIIYSIIAGGLIIVLGSILIVIRRR